MVKILYEGDDLQGVIKELKEESFIIMDKENRAHYPEEPFIVLVSHRRGLEEAGKGEYIYLSPSLKKELDLSEFPERIFLKELKEVEPFPEKLGISGDMSMAWHFLKHLLGEYLFSIGLSAKGYAETMFKNKVKSLRGDERKRLTEATTQPLQLFWEDYRQDIQLFFWSGREEDLFSFKERLTEDQEVWMVFKKKKHLVVTENQHIYLWKKTKGSKKNFSELWKALSSTETP